MTATVLVVDDIEPNRRLLQAKLEAKYYTVFSAENGERAIESAVQHQPDIILLDVMMPGMDGYEVCRRLKGMPQTKHIPIVMVTALVNVEDRLKGLQSGADDFLSKPVDDFGLFTRLETQMRFNLVANELRVRGKRNTPITQFSAYEKELIDAPSNVLVIDQDNVEARRVAAALEAMGHTAVTWIDASSGSIKFRDLDLVIVALSDQSHDALKLCAHLRTLKEARDFSIVVTYDTADQQRALEALRIGAADLISTPLEMAELQVRVRTQTHRQRYIDVLRHRVDRGM
ncbi:MAG: response regulator, partial [Pseudomonadota bacterium]